MTKIKRIYLENFKGVKGFHTIEMNSESTLLMGPNGFGKTTIFDVIELCVTKSIHRTEITKVTNDSRDYSKPFFQNESEKDVCIKVWFENEQHQDLIIVRYYDHDQLRKYTGRKNKPSDFDNLFDLYTQEPSDFDQPVVKEQLKQLNEKDISNYFGLNHKGYNIADIYKLFIYLQQEETTFFLKQAEGARKTSLGFLFESSQQERRERDFFSQATMLSRAIAELKSKKKGLNQVDFNQSAVYEKIFSWRETDTLDQRYPFEHIATELLSFTRARLVEQLTNIQEFITSFSPSEYQKKFYDDYFSQNIYKKDFCEALVLEFFLNDPTFLQQQHAHEDVLKTNDYPTRIILDLVGFDGKKLAKEADDYQFISRMLINKDNLFDFEITKLEKYFQMTGFDEDAIQYFVKLMKEKRDYENTLGLLDKQISEMNRTRENLHEKHQDSNQILKEHLCPYCGNDWILKEKLEKAYEELTERLTEENAHIHKLIRKIDEEIRQKFFLPANQSAESIQQDLNPLPDELIKFIQENQQKDLNNDYLTRMQAGLGEEIKTLIKRDYKNLSDFIDNVTKTWQYLKDQWLASKDLIDILESLSVKDFSQQKEYLKKAFEKENFAEYKLPISSKISIEQLNTEVSRLVTRLQSLRQKFTYDTNAIQDPNNIYETVFDKSEQNFSMIDTEKLATKMIYLEYQYAKANNQKLQQINERIELLEKAFADSKAIQRTYKDQITSYKNDMVKILKVPFFILTGKILQNYQQGMGVFIVSSDNGGIRFITDQTSDHDAMHHLSTGQISVISLAFTLACKKCYKVARQMDFLVIDDPIQDMDALNIQSFVDVLRRNYLADNQIILSTHSDNSAALIKYKLERFSAEKKVEFIDVQREFF